MASRTFKLKDASSTGYGTLTEATATAGTMGSGWTVATTTANAFSTMLYGTTRAANTFTTGVDQLSTQANFATGQAWRTDNPIHGTFSSASNWTFSVAIIAVSTAASQTGRIKARLWKSSDPVGATANQTQLTIATAAGFLTGTTAAFTKATAGLSTWSWTPTGIAAFDNEYLFVSMEWNTVVAGTRAGCDAIFVATANSNVITSDFTATTTAATATESISEADSATALRFTRSTGAESLSIVDTQSATVKTTPLFITEVLSPSDSQSGTIPSTGPLNFARNYYAFSPTQLFIRFGYSYRDIVSAAITGTTQETISPVDTQSASRTTKATAAETITPVDSQSTLRATKATASESISPVDTQSAIYRTRSTQSESVTAVDTQTARTRTLVTGTETISLVDTQTATAVHPSTASNIQESITVVDTQTARIRTTPLFTTESITPVDSQSALRTTKATQAEAISELDSQSAVKRTLSTSTETITPTDSQSRARFTPATAAESITPVDSQSTKARFGTTQPETIAVIDSQSAREIARAVIVETINPLDITQGFTGNILIGNCPETISPADQCDATLISGQRVDTHDGVGKKKKKKKRTDFAEEIDRRERIRRQIQEVIHPPIVPKLPPEEPEAAPVEVKPKPPLDLKSLATPAVDYAGLARKEIIGKIQKDAEERAKQEEIKAREAAELKRLEDEDEAMVEELILKEFL